MELSITVLKDKDRGKLLDGSSIALEATTLDPTTRTGADQEIMHHLDHVFLLEMIMLCIPPPSSAKLQTIKNVRSTERQANALNAGNKVILFMIVLTKRHVLVRLAPFKSKTTRNQLPLNLLPHLHLLLYK